MYTTTRLRGGTTQKTANLKAMAKRTSNLTESVHIIHAINHTVQKLQHSIKLQAFRHSSRVNTTVCLLMKVWGNVSSVLTYHEQAHVLKPPQYSHNIVRWPITWIGSAIFPDDGNKEGCQNTWLLLWFEEASCPERFYPLQPPQMLHNLYLPM